MIFGKLLSRLKHSMIKFEISVSDLSHLRIFSNLEILATTGGRTMHAGRLIIDINIVQNDIYDNFYSDHKAVQSNLTELFFLNLMNRLRCSFLTVTFFSHYLERGILLHWKSEQISYRLYKITKVLNFVSVRTEFYPTTCFRVLPEMRHSPFIHPNVSSVI